MGPSELQARTVTESAQKHERPDSVGGAFVLLWPLSSGSSCLKPDAIRRLRRWRSRRQGDAVRGKVMRSALVEQPINLDPSLGPLCHADSG
jgi:hypothetical protein